jgi:hypothetical protein
MPKLKVGGVEIGLPYPKGRARRGAAAALFAGLALSSFAAPVMAQLPAPRGENETEASTAEDRLALLHFSRCVAARQATQASALILTDYTTSAYRDSLRRLTVPQHGCLPGGNGRLRFGGLLFAGDLAETLLPDLAPRGSLAAHVTLNPAVAPFRAHDQGEVMSVCVVRAAPADTEALLATEQGSAEEGAALRVIAPHIGPCLAAGAAMRLNRPGVRAMLALAAYRLVRHNAAAPAAAAGGN